jgi:hypothetical protein
VIDLRGERLDRLVLLGLQALVVGVPLLLGGVHDGTLGLACPVVFALLAATVWRRWQLGTTDGAPGVAALAAFAGRRGGRRRSSRSRCRSSCCASRSASARSR